MIYSTNIQVQCWREPEYSSGGTGALNTGSLLRGSLYYGYGFRYIMDIDIAILWI